MLDVHPTSQHLRLLDLLTVLSRLLAAALLYLSSSYLTLFDSSPRTVLAPSAYPSFASSLLRWDAFHFTTIAKDGYSYEPHWAFYPGVPLLLRGAGHLPAPFLNDATSALSWLALLHTAIAIPTTRAIYHLTMTHFQSPSFALLTALLSLLPASPATLYFAPYAEPIFTFLSYQGACACFYDSPRFSPPLWGLLHTLGMLACARVHYHRASLYFAAAAAFRSNGVLLALYVPWSLLIDPLLLSSTLPRPSVVFRACLHALLPLLPSFFHQLNAYRTFCLAPATTPTSPPPPLLQRVPHIFALKWQAGRSQTGQNDSTRRAWYNIRRHLAHERAYTDRAPIAPGTAEYILVRRNPAHRPATMGQSICRLGGAVGGREYRTMGHILASRVGIQPYTTLSSTCATTSQVAQQNVGSHQDFNKRVNPRSHIYLELVGRAAATRPGHQRQDARF